MNENSQEIVVCPRELRKFVSEVYQKVGVPAEDADAVADQRP